MKPDFWFRLPKFLEAQKLGLLPVNMDNCASCSPLFSLEWDYILYFILFVSRLQRKQSLIKRKFFTLKYGSPKFHGKLELMSHRTLASHHVYSCWFNTTPGRHQHIPHFQETVWWESRSCGCVGIWSTPHPSTLVTCGISSEWAPPRSQLVSIVTGAVTNWAALSTTETK